MDYHDYDRPPLEELRPGVWTRPTPSDQPLPTSVLLFDVAAAYAIDLYNARDHRCVACFAEDAAIAAGRYDLDPVLLLRHLVLGIAASVEE
jgi:hypothetical protein